MPYTIEDAKAKMDGKWATLGRTDDGKRLIGRPSCPGPILLFRGPTTIDAKRQSKSTLRASVYLKQLLNHGRPLEKWRDLLELEYPDGFTLRDGTSLFVVGEADTEYEIESVEEQKVTAMNGVDVDVWRTVHYAPVKAAVLKLPAGPRADAAKVAREALYKALNFFPEPA